MLKVGDGVFSLAAIIILWWQAGLSWGVFAFLLAAGWLLNWLCDYAAAEAVES